MGSHNPASRKARGIKHTVLVVDTDDRTVSRLSHLLTRFDCRAIQSATGHEALEKAAGFTPSIVIASADLPDMDISELIRRIRKSSGTAHIPVVALLSGADRDLCGTCVKQGAAGCVFRPVEAESLFRTMEDALEKNPRKTLRVRTVLPVKVHGAQHAALYGAYSLALSSGGMFLRTMNPVSVNSPISLEFDLDGQPIIAESVVIYNCQSGCGPDAETGVGLRFVDMTSADRDLINEFVKKEVMKDVNAGAR